MKVLYYSDVIFSDCDFPLLKSMLNKGIDIKYLLLVRQEQKQGGLFNFSDLSKETYIDGKRIKELQQYKDYIDISKIKVISRTRNLFNIFNWFLSIKIFSSICRFNPDIIHITQPLAVLDWLIYIFHKKIVITVHDPILHSGEESRKQEFMRNIAFKFASVLFLLNNKQTSEFIRKYKINEKKIRFNKLGVYDAIRYSETCKTRIIKDDYILFFGHISPYKGVDILCESMLYVKKEHPNIKCVIAGKGNFDFNISKYKDDPNIVIINRFIDLDELSSLISNSLFVVCPYKDATQSGVVASAFAFSKPVVASNVGGFIETIEDGKNGKLVTPNNSIALGNAINELLRNRQKLNRMSRNIENSYLNGENSWNNIAMNYINGYLKN